MTDRAAGGGAGADDPDAASTVDLLVVGDLHLRPTGERFPVGDLPVAAHDAVVSLGDVIDENREHAPSTAAGEAYEERGRACYEALDDRGVPVLAVPGNHDPVACTRRLTDGLATVAPLHRKTRRVPAPDGSWALTVAGWGCEAFDFTPALLAPDYPDLPASATGAAGADPDDGAGATKPRTAAAVADAVLRAAGAHLAGDLDAAALADRLDTTPDDERFRASLDRLHERFEAVVDLVGSASGPTLVTSHVSPFGVPFDRRSQHSHEGDHHFGSVALRLALAATAPAGCLSGHTHQPGTTAVATTDGHAYAHNPGAPGVTSVTVHRDGTVHTERLEIG
jgi:Icc-related predicted phosphoesterase